MSSKVEIKGISKSYEKGKPVLKPTDLTVEQGELFFLLGSSGCGKSTLLRIIAGLLEPDSGKIFFNGKDVTNLAPEKRHVSMVFQNYALWPHLNVFENVAFGLKIQGCSKKELTSTVNDLLELVRLSDCGTRKIQSLSGGQQQRVALARALAANPEVLLLDEPLSNLDARLRDEMRVEIRRICKERKLTAFYVTHDRKEALSMADRIGVLRDGRLCQIGSPVELYKYPCESFVASFLGDANLINGKIISADENYAEVETSLGILKAKLPPEINVKPAMSTVLMVRPASFRFNKRPGDFAINVKPVESVYLGERMEWMFSARDIMLSMFDSEAATLPETVEELRLYIDAEHITLLPAETF